MQASVLCEIRMKNLEQSVKLHKTASCFRGKCVVMSGMYCKSVAFQANLKFVCIVFYHGVIFF